MALRPEEAGVSLHEDSEDLSDEEIASAVAMPAPEAIAEFLGRVTCSTPGCSLRATPTAYALRRRKPYLYWRVRLACEGGHDQRVVLRADWVQPLGVG
jgi:hypothetical protein